MILQTLVDHYDRLLAMGEIAPEGWTNERVAYVVELDISGNVTNIVSQAQISTDTSGKTRVIDRMFKVPARVKRTVNPLPNLLCDNSTYIFGFRINGKDIELRKDTFAICKAHHLEIFKDVTNDHVKSLRAFFENNDPDHLENNAIVAEKMADIGKGGNLLLAPLGKYAVDVPVITDIVDQHNQSTLSTVTGQCLITGKDAPIARLHPNIKGVRGAISSGAALVGFNAPAYSSYGYEQGENAPVSEKATFAYASALNHLLQDRESSQVIGDTTMVFWTTEDSRTPSYLFNQAFNGIDEKSGLTVNELEGIVRNLAKGYKTVFDEKEIDPDAPFYILGLAPNNARLSIRFFLQSSFGVFMKRLNEHWERLEIVRPAYDKRAILSFWGLLNETANQKSRDKSPSPQLAGDVIKAVLAGERYPDTLYYAVQRRIAAEPGAVTRGRAAIIKAYLLKNSDNQTIKEVIRTVKLNEETSNVPYVLGRLFAVLEGIQQAANPGINTTIKDRYFSSACGTPGMVLSSLVTLAQSHLKKLNGISPALKVHYEKQIQDLLGRLDKPYPMHLNLQEQGIFQLGYYHQTQKRFANKEEK